MPFFSPTPDLGLAAALALLFALLNIGASRAALWLARLHTEEKNDSSSRRRFTTRDTTTRRRANEAGGVSTLDRDDSAEAVKRLAHAYRRRISRGGNALLTVAFVLGVARLSGEEGGRDAAVDAGETRWRAIRLTRPNPSAAAAAGGVPAPAPARVSIRVARPTSRGRAPPAALRPIPGRTDNLRALDVLHPEDAPALVSFMESLAPWSNREDSVDLVTDQQLNVYLEGDVNDGWYLPMRPMKPLVEAIDAQVLRPTLRWLCAHGGANDHGEVGCPRDWKNRNILSGLPRLKSVFVRKYDDGARNNLRAHSDQSTFTFNLALENPWDEDIADDDAADDADVSRHGKSSREEEVSRGEKKIGERDEGEAPTAVADTAGGQLFVCNPLPYTYSQLLTIHQSMSRDVAPTLLFDLRNPPATLAAAVGRTAAARGAGTGTGTGTRERGRGSEATAAGARAARVGCEHALVPAGAAVGHPGTRLHGVSKVSSIIPGGGGGGNRTHTAGDRGGREASEAASEAAATGGGEGENLGLERRRNGSAGPRPRRRRRRVSMIFFYGDDETWSPSVRAAAASVTMPRVDMLAWFTSLAALARPAYAFEDEREEAHLDHWVRLNFLEISRVLKRGAEEEEGSGGTTRSRGDGDEKNAAADPEVAAEGLKALASAVRFRGRRLTRAPVPTDLQVRLGNEAAIGWLDRARPTDLQQQVEPSRQTTTTTTTTNTTTTTTNTTTTTRVASSIVSAACLLMNGLSQQSSGVGYRGGGGGGGGNAAAAAAAAAAVAIDPRCVGLDLGPDGGAALAVDAAGELACAERLALRETCYGKSQAVEKKRIGSGGGGGGGGGGVDEDDGVVPCFRLLDDWRCTERGGQGRLTDTDPCWDAHPCFDSTVSSQRTGSNNIA